MKILLTGATGFIGRHVLSELLQAGHEVRAVRRRPADAAAHERLEWQTIADIGPDAHWSEALRGMDAVVHLAGHAHRPGESPSAAAQAHERINHQGSRRLAEVAEGQVSRFLFLSSIAVHGLRQSEEAITEATPVRPDGPYGEAKARAEEYLIDAHQQGRLQSLSLRIPLVVGPGAPGNLGRLQRAVARGLPLPLASARNQRSLLGVRHLARALRIALEADTIAGPVNTLADAETISTADMIRALAAGIDRAPRLLPFPPAVLGGAARLLGKGGMAAQLIGSLRVDASGFRKAFGDCQTQTSDEALRESMSMQEKGKGSRG